MKNRFKKGISLLLAAMLLLAMFTGCNPGNNSSTPPSESNSQGSETPTGNAGREKVRIVFSQPNTVLDNTDKLNNDPIRKAIEEAVNIELAYDSGFDGYPDRIQTELIAQTGADLFPNYGQQELTTKWINDGLVCNIGEIINADPERYPILYKMINTPEYQMYNQMYAGDPEKTYAIYALTAAKTWSGPSLYNTELLEKAGFEEPPVTVDEFVEFCITLGQQGISGWWPRNDTLTNLDEIDKTLFAPNGTTVMAPTGDPWVGFIPVDGPDGIEGDWKLMTTSDETKEVLKVLADMYQKGGLDKGIGVKDDWAQAYTEFISGQIGACNYRFSTWTAVKGIMVDWMEANPDSNFAEDVRLGKNLEGSIGMGVTYSAPYWMGFNWFIPASCAAPDRVLDLVEFLATDEGQNLIFRGIEGQHYELDEDGNVVYDVEAWTETGKIFNVDDGRTKYIVFAYLFAGGQEQLELEGSDNWYEASLNPIKVDTHDDDGEAKDYVNSVIDSYSDEAAGFLPPYFTIIQYPAEIVEIRTKLKEITLQYVPAFITGQKSIDDEWDDYAVTV